MTTANITEKLTVRQSGKPQVAPNEKAVKDKVKKIIELYSKYNPIYSFCPMTFGYGESGHPDRILLVNGKFVGIEVKKDENNHHCRPELKPKSNEVMQKRQAQKITNAGGAWICIHNNNLQDLVDLLDSKCRTDSSQFEIGDYDMLLKLKG